MKSKEHDHVVTEHYQSAKAEHVGGKNRQKYKKHYRFNAQKLLQSVKKVFGY